MKYALAAINLLVAAATAQAGSISVSVTNSQGTITKGVTISDADIDRIIAAYRTLRNFDPGITNQQVIQNVEMGMIGEVKADVMRAEQGSAAATASGTVQPVTMQ